MENGYLPHELKVAVLAQLDKRDLKNVRLVSKEWSALATDPLFDRVYISCREPDLEIFRNITRHPVISTGVRELVYDDSFFVKDLSFGDYFEQVFEAVHYLAPSWQSDISIGSANVEIDEFCRDCQRTDPDVEELYESHGKDTFLVDGYQIYKEYSAFEWQNIECGWFFDELSTGLGSLKNLRSVVFHHIHWEVSSDCNKFFKAPKYNKLHGLFSGSPLSRIWNQFHLGPVGWRNLSDLETGRSRITAQFRMLTQAICATNKRLTSLCTLDFDGCLPHQALTMSTLTNSDLEHFMTAYSGLRCLDMRVAADSADHQDALIVLPDLLRQMYGLERLSLRFSRDHFQDALVPKYHYDEIFPAFGLGPAVKELSLFGVAIGGWDLLTRVLGQARPARLELGQIDLLDGTWEGVIEGLRQWSGVTEMNMCLTFTHRGGAVFRPDGPSSDRKSMTQQSFLRRIESYVVRGGRHPCLTPDCDPMTTVWWLQDLVPGERLEKMKLFAREQGLYIESSWWK